MSTFSWLGISFVPLYIFLETNLGLFLFSHIRFLMAKVSLIKHTECTGGNTKVSADVQFFKIHEKMYMLKKSHKEN